MKPLSLINEKVLVWGHRGARSLAAENTLRAMKKAHEAGANGWELDVQFTKDGELIVLHDLNLLRSTNAKVHPLFNGKGQPLPWRFNLKELRELSANVFPRRFCPPHYSDKPWLEIPDAVESDVRIPTLKEVLDLARDLKMWLNIEIKDISHVVPRELERTIVKRVHDLVSAERMKDQVILSSFNHNYMAQSKELDKDMLTGLLTCHKFTQDPVELIRKHKADAWHPGFHCLTEEIVRNVRAAGIAINPYTVNDVNIMKELATWGVTGIVTDTPQNVPAEIRF